MRAGIDVVVPSVGRPSLARLLDALATGEPPPGARVIVVDDRGGAPEMNLGERPGLTVGLVAGPGRGPGAARNAGWRASRADWIAFLDDDVVPEAGWWSTLLSDLAGLEPDVAGSQGAIAVPLPADRAPTDWERNVAGLERARWATADMAYRRRALADVGGFDERFPRAYREDADMGLRLLAHRWRIVGGERRVVHPVPPASAWVSLAKQSGNADDVLMRALHGRGWRERAGAPAGRRSRHLATAAAGLAALAGVASGRRGLAAGAASAWVAGTAELAWARIAPGPRGPGEVATMLATSALMPAFASAWTLAGAVSLPAKLRRGAPEPAKRAAAAGRGSDGSVNLPAAILFDRDGTLVEDVPYNRDPALVRPAPGVEAALARLRERRIPTAVISNQSGVGRGLMSLAEVEAVNERIDELLGPLGPWLVCPHAPEDGCGCRKPAPGLLVAAAERLGVEPSECAVIGDIGADVEAARRVGARAVLVPTSATRRAEVDAAPAVAPSVEAAVEMLIGGAA